MKKSYVILGIVALVIILSYSWIKGSYNSMVTLEEGVTEKWSQVENVYQRRADLIPNLVNVVKGYAAHEKSTLEGVIEARAKATSVNINADNLNAESLQKFQAAQSGLSSALSKLMVVVERYPDLKANENFRDLQAQLEGTENRIATARMRFNDETKKYNTIVRQFPGNIIAGWYNFEEKVYFEAERGTEKAPVVEF